MRRRVIFIVFNHDKWGEGGRVFPLELGPLSIVRSGTVEGCSLPGLSRPVTVQSTKGRPMGYK
jgi:hypothetical protein